MKFAVSAVIALVLSPLLAGAHDVRVENGAHHGHNRKKERGGEPKHEEEGRYGYPTMAPYDYGHFPTSAPYDWNSYPTYAPYDWNSYPTSAPYAMRSGEKKERAGHKHHVAPKKDNEGRYEYPTMAPYDYGHFPTSAPYDWNSYPTYAPYDWNSYPTSAPYAMRSGEKKERTHHAEGRCADDAAWKDSYGDGCGLYKENQEWCSMYASETGTNSAGNTVPLAEGCCAACKDAPAAGEYPTSAPYSWESYPTSAPYSWESYPTSAPYSWESYPTSAPYAMRSGEKKERTHYHHAEGRCSDDAAWKDSYEDDCATYKENPSWCSYYAEETGKDSSGNTVPVGVACCAACKDAPLDFTGGPTTGPTGYTVPTSGPTGSGPYRSGEKRTGGRPKPKKDKEGRYGYPTMAPYDYGHFPTSAPYDWNSYPTSAPYDWNSYPTYAPYDWNSYPTSAPYAMRSGEKKERTHRHHAEGRCADDAAWKDSYGDGCGLYKENQEWCSMYASETGTNSAGNTVPLAEGCCAACKDAPAAGEYPTSAPYSWESYPTSAPYSWESYPTSAPYSWESYPTSAPYAMRSGENESHEDEDESDGNSDESDGNSDESDGNSDESDGNSNEDSRE